MFFTIYSNLFIEMHIDEDESSYNSLKPIFLLFGGPWSIQITQKWALGPTYHLNFGPTYDDNG